MGVKGLEVKLAWSHLVSALLCWIPPQLPLPCREQEQTHWTRSACLPDTQSGRYVQKIKPLFSAALLELMDLTDSDPKAHILVKGNATEHILNIHRICPLLVETLPLQLSFPIGWLLTGRWHIWWQLLCAKTCNQNTLVPFHVGAQQLVVKEDSERLCWWSKWHYSSNMWHNWHFLSRLQLSQIWRKFRSWALSFLRNNKSISLTNHFNHSRASSNSSTHSTCSTSHRHLGFSYFYQGQSVIVWFVQ